MLVGGLAVLGALAGVQVLTQDDGSGDEVGVEVDDGAGAPSTDTSDGSSVPGDTGPVAPALPPRPPASQLQGLALRFDPVLPGLRNLTGMVWNEDQAAFYAVTQDGFVHRLAPDLSGSEQVMDLSAEGTVLEPGSERGPLGIAFVPRDGRMFLHYNDRGDDTNIASYAMVDGRPDPTSRRLVLFVEQPGKGHKGGKLLFADDGTLYVGLGDGGGSRGRDAQDPAKLLGAIVRITPRLDAEGYDIPADNPHVSSPGYRPEIFAKGLRNPWQFTVDPATGDVYIADVGEDTIEELDVVPAGTSGQNFGWYWFEGSQDRGIGGVPEGLVLTPPIFEYRHDEIGPAVIGGQMYSGSAIPALQGAFVFGDMTGPMFAMGASDEVVRLDIPRPGEGDFGVMTSVAAGPDGELYVLTLRKGIYRLVPG